MTTTMNPQTTSKISRADQRRIDRQAARAARAAADRAANPDHYAALDAWWDSTAEPAADNSPIDPAEYAATDGAARTYGTGTGSGRSTAEAATPKQVAFLAKLIAERPAAAAAKNLDAATVATLTKREASKQIDSLCTLPREAAPTVDGGEVECRWTKHDGQWVVRTASGMTAGTTVEVHKASGDVVEAILDRQVGDNIWTVRKAAAEAPETLPAVPAGYYALESSGHNDLAFYVVQHGEGRWAGRTFVKLVVGGHADRNVARNQIAGILARIVEAGPEAAGRLYGQEIGRCCRCGRHLTDEASRSAGIGPDCAKKEW